MSHGDKGHAMSFGERLRQIRRARGHETCTSAAEAIGMHVSNYWRLENQPGIDPYWSTVLKICRAFGISPEALVPRGKD
jgi:transcriptional regulator with XRE-family HTH domain